jgi:hypothetical protein
MRLETLNKLVAHLVELCVLSVMAVLLPLSPVASTLLSGDIGYVRRYRATLGACVRMMSALWRTHVVARNFERVLPGADTEPQRIEGACTHCGRCCVDKSCVFLQWDVQGHSRCAIYNNWFWKLTSCGGYPVDAHSIQVYGCPSFKAVPLRAIPIKVQLQPRRGPEQH